MLIGILYEGKYDKKALQQIVTLIVIKNRPEIHQNLEFVLERAGGNILGYIVKTASLFFRANRCDIGIFVSDVDEDLKLGFKKVSSIKTKCKMHIRSTYPTAKYVLAFPKPELEEWFFSEENSLRNVLKIPVGEDIKYNSYTSKERLKKLINDFRSVVLTQEDIYEKIAQNLNIDKLLTDISFKKFYDELTKLL